MRTPELAPASPSLAAPVRLSVSALGLLALASAGLPHAKSGETGSWPQWRGPERDGISRQSGWNPAGKKEPLWSRNVGLGYSSFAVQDGRLYTMGHDEEAGLDVVVCLDALTGEEIWAQAYPAKIWNQAHGGGTLTTPSIDGDVVYTLNREGNFYCFDAETGEVEWSKGLKEELELQYPTWGFSASPLVLEDAVILNLGRVFAFDKKSGEVLWESDDYGHAYSTPSPFEHHGRPRLAVLNGRGLAVLDRASGDEMFFHEWKTSYDINAATPIVDGTKIFISSGYDHGCALVDFAADGAQVLWENKNMRNKMSGSVLWEGHYYGFDESLFKCLGPDGEEKWRQRGLGNGAFMIADGKLILVSGDGELIVAAASPAGFQEISRAKVLDGGVYWTSPVIVDGLIYVRNSKGDLVCRDHREA